MDSTPELSDLLADAMDVRMDRVWTSLIGRVVNYNAATSTADVQPLGANRYVGETGNVVVEELPVLPMVPVVQVSGGGYQLSMPVAVGDQVLVVVCSNPIGNWQLSGGTYDHGLIGNNHHLDGAVAIAGLFPAKRPKRFTDTDGAVLGNPTTGLAIKVSDTVALGSTSATQAVILGNAFVSAMDTLVTAIATAISTNIPTGGSATATAITSALATFNTASAGFLSAIVKAT